MNCLYVFNVPVELFRVILSALYHCIIIYEQPIRQAAILSVKTKQLSSHVVCCGHQWEYNALMAKNNINEQKKSRIESLYSCNSKFTVCFVESNICLQ